jgi:hypothetical protein
MLNLIDQSDILKGLDDQTLQREMQQPSGGAPPFLVLSEISRRKDMRQRYAGEIANRIPKTTVMQDVLAAPTMPGMGDTGAGPAPGGIAAAAQMGAPMPMPASGGPGYASGGIVSAVDPSYDYEALTKRYQSDLDAIPSERNQAAALALLAAGAGIMGGGHSNLGQNLGVGIGAGIDAYTGQLKVTDSREAAALRGLTDLAQAQHGDALQQLQMTRMQQEIDQNTPEYWRKEGIKQGMTGDDLERYASTLGKVGKSHFAAASTTGVDENGDTITARYNQTTGEYVPNPRPDGSTPKAFTPYTASEVAQQGVDRKYQQTLKAAEPKDSMALKTLDEGTQVAVKTIDEVSNDVNSWTAGLIGDVSKNIGFGPAYDLFERTKTLVSKTAFDAIQAMRAANKSGGALGNVSDKDIELLQTELTNLSAAQNPEIFKENLATLRQHMIDALDIRKQMYKDTYGEEAPTWTATTPPPIGGVSDPNRSAGTVDLVLKQKYGLD